LPSAIITDIDRRKALPIIRSLGRSGIKIIGLSYKKMSIGFFSRYCQKTLLIPDYREKPLDFILRFEEICKKEAPDVFFPIEDEILTLCARHPNSWKPYTRTLIPEKSALDRAYDKWKTVQIAQKLNVRIPVTFCPENIDEVSSLTANWKGEAVIKPRKSSGSRGIRYVKNPSQIPINYLEVSKKYPRPLIQERIPSEGEGMGVFVLLNDKLETIAIFGHKRLREFPISGGPSTLRKSFRDDYLIDQTVTLFKKMELKGVAMAEYKMDMRYNKPVLMEINPRFWGSLQLAIHAGVNFPVLYYQTALGIKVNPILKFPDNKYCRWLLPGDILHFLANPKRFSLRPSFFKFFDHDLSYDIISADDPLPILGIFLESLSKLKRRI
jgi:predicted ATP-grasp superfamily ATP-dependent carboligase